MARVITVLAIMALSALPLTGQGGGGQGGQPAQPMGFFITSMPMSGANLGGLAGADKHCQTLAAASGGRRQSRMAGLPEHAGPGRRQCP